MTKKNVIALGIAALLAGWTLTAGAETAPEVSFGGQYRINSYTLWDKDGAGNIAASRVRIRQNVDLKFSEQFSTHIQLNIGHINEGTDNHNLNQSNQPSVGLRHAVMTYKFSDAVILKAGLVPIADKFGDTLFSSDWDFNPLAYELLGNAGTLDYRVAYFKIAENNELDEKTGAVPQKTMNDVDGYLVDFGGDFGPAKAGLMGLLIQTPNVAEDGYDSNYWYGARGDGKVSKINWHLSVVGSSVNKSAASTSDDATGVQVLAKIDGMVGNLGWGVLALDTSGENGTKKGFISPQSIYGGQGYWGKTGILNIQGPTDTGMDVNMLRSDDGGLGLMTIQANISRPIVTNLSGYLGAGWYQANADNIYGSKDIGTDVYGQLKYSFPNSPLAIEAGVDVASLGKAAPNSGGNTRTATAVFSRLQAQF